MANLTGSERARYVQTMFARISRRYDFMNRVMTVGQDTRWRREAIRRAALPQKGRLLDLGAGTGDLAYEALRQCAACRVVAADFTLEMMLTGRSRRVQGQHLDWSAADAGCLPFPDGVFQAVVSGFLLRNVPDISLSLREQSRILSEGGWVVALDTAPPPAGPLAPFIRFHLHTVIPLLGRLIAGQAEAYRYLPDSTESFLEPEQLAGRFLEAGLEQVGFHRLMFGTIAIHWGRKPYHKKQGAA